jgi:hypothetical protein
MTSIITLERERAPQMSCKFEFTAPDSPQQNGKNKRKFATLYGRVQSYPEWCRIYTNFEKCVMWAFCSLHATRLDTILIRPDTHLSPYEIYHEETPTWIPFLKAFGDIAI